MPNSPKSFGLPGMAHTYALLHLVEMYTAQLQKWRLYQQYVTRASPRFRSFSATGLVTSTQKNFDFGVFQLAFVYQKILLFWKKLLCFKRFRCVLENIVVFQKISLCSNACDISSNFSLLDCILHPYALLREFLPSSDQS